MRTDNSKEIFPIVSEDGTVTGSATRGECHNGSKLLHPVVHLHVYDNNGNLYLQKRPEWKDIQPGKWDTAVGGHVDFGEQIEDALRREAKEEIGLTGFDAEFIGSYIFESDRERELVNAYRTTTDCIPQPSEELDGGCFWSIEEINQSLGKGVFTPNFESEYRRLSLDNQKTQ